MKSLLTLALILGSLTALTACSSAPLTRDPSAENCIHSPERYDSRTSGVCEDQAMLPER